MQKTKQIMEKLALILLISMLLTISVNALSPAKLIKLEPVDIGYSDEEINIITNVVNGEVGGLCGTIILTYADGSQVYTDGSTIHMIHAKVIDNQVKSSMLPSTVYECVKQYWSSGYTGTAWRNSSQWQECRQDVLKALAGDIDVLDNIFAATCDPYFCQKYTKYELYARVDWDTGWCSGTFYYYTFKG